MNIYAKSGDKVIYIGANEEQIKYRGYSDPREILLIGNEYVIDYTEVGSWDTSVYLKGHTARFNSVFFSDSLESDQDMTQPLQQSIDGQMCDLVPRTSDTGQEDIAAIRLRMLCKILDLQNSIPKDDKELMEVQFSVFGMMLNKLTNFIAKKTSNVRCLYPHCQRGTGDVPCACSIVPQVAQPSAESMPSRDWPEDFTHENGNYQCRCIFCECMFVGHKRRVICKACQASDATPPTVDQDGVKP